jgi:hypothetical protein
MEEILRTMNTKLTLSVDQEVIKKAKQFARDRGRSLSSLVEDYLKLVTGPPQKPVSEMSPLVKSLYGCISVPPDFDDKEELKKAIYKKYLGHE